MAEKFIQKAIKRPGALRAKAKRAGLIKGDEPLSQSDLDIMLKRAKARGDLKTVRQINLARTLKRIGRKRAKN